MQIYIHVPFCRTRCRYCAFHSLALGKRSSASSLVRQYVDTLLLELALWGDRLGRQPVSTVFFGGGTPSILPVSVIAALIARIRRYFKLEKGAEITLEGNPESLLERNYLPDLLGAGVNRISVGIQSLHTPHLKLLGRIHSARDAIHAVMAARAAGAQNLSLDLMWGLPGQGVRQWLTMLKEVLQLRPEHLSLYALTLEPGTPLEEDWQHGTVELPAERDQALMYVEGAALLESAGYIHYEISNFARMGFQCRHNLGYWEGAEYLGLGPSATSTLRGRRWTNSAVSLEWAAAVKNGATDEAAETLTLQARVLELIMLRLRTSRGLRVKAYRDLTGRDFLRDHKALIHALHERGLIRIRNGYLRFTRSGMLVSNSILSKFFADTEAKFLETGRGSRGAVESL
ncbi:MAG: radical SAM family heme chaperone HemW [Deltaproteobacteria bacterium]|jgi:oxygen-independent coproporphyrinogen-3 oxidase|nr:radical SAM family heme chaperone HemW [Deltaproteobacteria bacterium]